MALCVPGCRFLLEEKTVKYKARLVVEIATYL
jgi:hypothetical protein